MDWVIWKALKLPRAPLPKKVGGAHRLAKKKRPKHAKREKEEW